MKRYVLRFSTGLVYEFEADYIDDKDGKMRLMKNNGDIVAAYQDSDIAACENTEDTSIASGETHLDDGAILYNEDGEVISIYRTQEAALQS